MLTAPRHTPKRGIFFLDKASDFDLMSGENKREYVIPTTDEQKYLEKARVGKLVVDRRRHYFARYRDAP